MITIVIYNFMHITTSVFINGYCNDIFSQKNSPQSIDENILSVCPFIFANFLIGITKKSSCLLTPEEDHMKMI
jgi:hypothetical protein